MTARELYAAMCQYARDTGWEREEEGSGWWFHKGFGDGRLGGAVETSLVDLDNIDVRVEP